MPVIGNIRIGKLKPTAIFAVLVSGSIVVLGYFITAKTRTSRLGSPRVGDIVVLRQNNGANYWPAIIEKVTEEVVFVRHSNYAYPSQSGVDKNLIADIKENQDFFNETVLSYPRKSLSSDNIEIVVRQ